MKFKALHPRETKGALFVNGLAPRNTFVSPSSKTFVKPLPQEPTNASNYKRLLVILNAKAHSESFEGLRSTGPKFPAYLGVKPFISNPYVTFCAPVALLSVGLVADGSMIVSHTVSDTYSVKVSGHCAEAKVS